METNFINNEKNYEEGVFCLEHNEKYIAFCKNCFINICIKSFNYHINHNHIIMSFKDIKIDDEKIKQLLKLINSNTKNYLINLKSSEKIFNDNYNIINSNNTKSEIFSEEENKEFNKLINIIINDYKIYPSFSHFFNIKNLFHFFNIEEDKSLVKNKLNKEIYNEFNKNSDEFIILLLNMLMIF